MQVNVREVATSMDAIDSEELLSQQLMDRIVTRVMRAMDERDEYRERVRQERCPTGGSEEAERGGGY